MQSFILPASLLLAVAISTGCHPKTHDAALLAETVVVGPEYSANKGLFVPEDTRQSLGLKIVETGEQKITASLDLSLRVYENTGNFFRASGLVVPEQARALQPGQPVQVHAGGGRDIPARIVALDDKTQKATGAVEVLVEIPRPAELALDSFVPATVTFEGNEIVATVPRSALGQSTEGFFVYAVSGKHFVRTPVKIGALNADIAEVKEGLYAGDQVVSEPVMSLWMTELAAVKGGHACCAVPAKGK